MTDGFTTAPVPTLADLAFPSDEVTECPFPFYAALRREAPVFRDPSGSDYLVSRRKDIMFIMQHPEIFSNQVYRKDSRLVDDPREIIGLSDAALPGCPFETPYNMSKSDPPEHTIKRRAASDLVSRRRGASGDRDDLRPHFRRRLVAKFRRLLQSAEDDFVESYVDLHSVKAG